MCRLILKLATRNKEQMSPIKQVSIEKSTNNYSREYKVQFSITSTPVYALAKTANNVC